MTKHFLRSIMVGFCIFTATLIVAYITFTYANRITSERATEALSESLPISASATSPLSGGEVLTADYYLARCNENGLAVYAVNDETEEFLYTLDIRLEDISKTELDELKLGVILKDKQALASFEEDFTS